MNGAKEKWNHERILEPGLKLEGDLAVVRKELLLTPDFVPSMAMRRFWEKEPWRFEDEDVVTIICNSNASRDVKRKALKKLGIMTHDDPFVREAFANKFVNLNTPFLRGDIVKSSFDGSRHGILMNGGRICTEEEMDENKEWFRRDYGDVQFRVEWIDEEGKFYHGHVNPLYLDYYEPVEGDGDYEVLMEASLLVKGDVHASLQTFQMACERWAK